MSMETLIYIPTILLTLKSVDQRSNYPGEEKFSSCIPIVIAMNSARDTLQMKRHRIDIESDYIKC